MVLPAVQPIRQNDDGSGMAGTHKFAALVVLALLLVPAAASAKQARPYAPSEQKSFDVVLTKWTPVMKTPGGTSVFELQPATFYRQKAQRLLVLEGRDVGSTRWLRVRLPAWFSHGMPSGWIRADRVQLRVNPWRVEISREAGTLKLVHDGQVVRTAHVGTGTSSTPTPRGLHATYDHWRSTASVLGDWTVSLTTQSPRCRSSTACRRSWRSTAGTRAAAAAARCSHGCVRVTDDSLMRMVALELPLGTPVQVT